MSKGSVGLNEVACTHLPCMLLASFMPAWDSCSGAGVGKVPGLPLREELVPGGGMALGVGRGAFLRIVTVLSRSFAAADCPNFCASASLPLLCAQTYICLPTHD